MPQIRTIYHFLWLMCTLFLFIFSCSIDNDLLLESVTENDTAMLSDLDFPEGYLAIERRITAFPVKYDAYIEDGEVYNQTVLRLGKNEQTSYLLFDLSPIDSIEGTIKAAELELVVDSNSGSGKIEIFKGSANYWTENNLTYTSAPELENQMAIIEQNYALNDTISIGLNVDALFPETLTLVLVQEDGDDLAFASKEHETKVGGTLIVTYNAPIAAEEIVIENTTDQEAEEDEATQEEEIAEEESEEEQVAEEEEETEEEEVVQEEETEEEETEEEETEEEETEEEEVAQGSETEEQVNSAPIAVIEAAPSSGTVPLTVSFTGNNSSDDKSVTEYQWNFKNGTTSNIVNPNYTFETAGTYEVELTVKDEEGLTNKKTITITVNPRPNEAPKAVASASILSGNAPLQVDFRGNNSSDDNGIVSYAWDFSGATASAMNAAHTFNDPGVYNITLTVTDAAGLQDTTNLSVTVTQEISEQIACSVGGGRANDTGEKVWCWENINIPEYSGSKGVAFSNGELVIDSECYEKQVTKSGNKLKFSVNPTSPNVPNWCSRDFNMRAEIRSAPWNVRHPKGTEEWFGWSYTFGNNYIVDKNNQWLFWQVHHGTVGDSPHTELMIIKDGQFNGHSAGELYVVNNASSSSKYNPTGITPRAGEKLDIVVHTVWNTGSSGLLQVWINGQKVHDEQGATIYAASPWGGNAKWGIYKWPWADANGVAQSQQQGIESLETYLGDLRVITRRDGDPEYLENSYSKVAPN